MDDQDASERSSPAGREKLAEVADTAKQEIGVVAGEVKHQAGRVASDVRHRVSEEAGHRQQELADRLRQTGEELREMAAGRHESPARMTVEQLAGRTEQVADYLSKRRPEDVLAEVQDFARRRPGAFLVSAAVAGFVVGRLAKGVLTDRFSGVGPSSGREGAVDTTTYRSASAPASPSTTAVDQVPAVGVAPAPETSYAAGVAPVPATVAAERVPPEHAPPPAAGPPVPPTTGPPPTAPPTGLPPTSGGETR